MGLLSSSKNSSFLGIDVGSTSIKIVEFQNNQNRAKLITYGYSETETIAADDDSEAALKAKAMVIKSILAKAKISSKRAVTALPTYAVFSSVLSFPSTLSKKDLPNAIRWEAKKLIPLPIQEMSLSWNQLPTDEDEEKKMNKLARPGENGAMLKNKNGINGQSEKPDSKKLAEEEPVKAKKSGFFGKNKFKKVVAKGKYQKILLTGAPNKLVKKYLTIFKLAGLNLISLETESFALVRALIGHDYNPAMIVNFGSITTTITIVDKGVAILNRSIDVGGNNITRLVSDSLSISKKRASYFKQDVGLTKGSGGGIADMITQALAPVVNEIKYTRNVWQNQSGKKITKVVLTGGSANLPELDSYLSDTLEVRTFLGDPWARVIYPEALKPVLNEIGTRMSVAVGLAMRNIE